MQALYNFFDLKMPVPTSYGWFHFLFIAIVIAVTVLLCTYFKNSSDKVFRRIMLISWILLVVLEIYKQLNYSISFPDGVFTWDYQWYAFPYQFCSTPLYVLPFLAFMKKGKVRDCFEAYISSFSLFAGLVVFIYPNNVFINTIGINIQTMVHHGSQIVLGIFCVVYNKKKLNFKYFLKAVPVFMTLLFIAVLLNETAGAYIKTAFDETFNMFYISRIFPCTLPLVSLFYPPTLPWFAFFLVYSLGFCLAATAIFYIVLGLIKLYDKIKIKISTAKN